MKKNYNELKSCCGDSIETVVNELLQHKENGELYKVSFNGHTLYSDTVTLDSAYTEITGITESEFQDKINKDRQEYENHKQKHKENIPKLTIEYIEKAKGIIPEDKMDQWKKIVPIRLDDLYEGVELDSALKAIKIWNETKDIEKVKKSLYDDGHSGMSHSLTVSIIKKFSDCDLSRR